LTTSNDISYPMSAGAPAESVPFLLVRASSGGAGGEEMTEDVSDVSSEHEIPVSRSVPPHAPPARTPMPEDLPTIIVDLREVAVTEEQEAQRASEVDGLIAAAEEIAVSEGRILIVASQPARRSRGVVAALLLTALAVAGTFAGLHARGLSAHDSVGASLHIAR
jgi:hypothetical protein